MGLLVLIFVAAILGGCGQRGFARLGQLVLVFGQAACNAATTGLHAFAEAFGIRFASLSAAAFGVATLAGRGVALCRGGATQGQQTQGEEGV
jgi:hypothetical protein